MIPGLSNCFPFLWPARTGEGEQRIAPANGGGQGVDPLAQQNQVNLGAATTTVENAEESVRTAQINLEDFQNRQAFFKAGVDLAGGIGVLGVGAVGIILSALSCGYFAVATAVAWLGYRTYVGITTAKLRYKISEALQDEIHRRQDLKAAFESKNKENSLEAKLNDLKLAEYRLKKFENQIAFVETGADILGVGALIGFGAVAIFSAVTWGAGVPVAGLVWGAVRLYVENTKSDLRAEVLRCKQIYSQENKSLLRGAESNQVVRDLRAQMRQNHAEAEVGRYEDMITARDLQEFNAT